MTGLKEKIDMMLRQVQKPARYTGSEWNAVQKDHTNVDLKMVLAFPDLYEVGMSNLGLKVLYEAVNRNDNYLMERVFAPAADMEEQMRVHKVPLFALESGRPLTEFDLVGFSLQYELCYSTVINMLDLAGIPICCRDRTDSDPLVVGGGPSTCNPEPVASFFDFFLIGDGEEALPELLEKLAGLKKAGLGRKEIIKGLSDLEGLYIPSFYEDQYNDGIYSGLVCTEPGAPLPVRKRVVKDFDKAVCPAAPPVSYLQAIHDRGVIELFRGCSRGCRFCQAGFIYRPVRRRSRETVVEAAKKTVALTGYDEISLSSLSSCDYPDIDLLIEELNAAFQGRKIKFSLPSLRLDSYSVKLAEQVHRGRRSSLTFAPEAATDRLRKVIGKNLSTGEIFSALDAAVEAGWQGFKLYFMIGLPTEERADVESIVDFCRDVRTRFKKKAGKKLDLSVSVSTFVPKAHTPFQWEPQISLAEIEERQRLLREGFKKIPGIRFSWHEAEASFLEAVFARGDRRLASVLEKAWQLGCRLDGWSEHFSFKLWKQAFEECSIRPEDYANRNFSLEDPLPWGHLHCGVSFDYLIRERENALDDARNWGVENE